MTYFEEILKKENHTQEDIILMLQAEGNDYELLLKRAYSLKRKHIGNKVFFRGLIELSNICSKNCMYCGIRKDNEKVDRYALTDEEVLSCARYAYEHKWGSIVIQSGELSTDNFTSRVEKLIREIKSIGKGALGITLSCGEQSDDVFKRWFEAGAHRYLLRIEASSKELYGKIHPQDENHSYQERIAALNRLKRIGYQTGTGVMIGLPFQTIEDLADDLMFMRELDIDMCGMGPYIEHEDTPLYSFRKAIPMLEDRLLLTFRMIACLRIIMPDINISSTTALQTIHPNGREMGLKAGANIIMPNITPVKYHGNYNLYKGKPQIPEETEDYIKSLEEQIKNAGDKVCYNAWGDSVHYLNKKK
ncbi:MAG: [FeFe] hydrogenase H-cluster radical SAM maturase HydE [Bacteroidales bacterium]|nr:[FeFe] hydrogenase H-cluster radical SAM maturase HydE [Bacteroidales bacterium]HOY39246.1 [FeFe] hydrogenase H-cluster radical SAM maturase HydE [Bacteroidales bacterium]HQP04221.1 [FeFe] hydrogenase H-cluster radical SAM maturase HydE [Bacteroidales bacterium]